MSQSRFLQVHRGLTESARKVYDCIPAQEGWGFAQINAELKRRNIGLQYNVMQGCVKALIDSGLAKEQRPGEFIREPVRPAASIKTTQEGNGETDVAPIIVMPHEPEKPSTGLTATDKLGALAARLRTLSADALQLHHRLVGIADDIDTIAIEVEDAHNNPEIVRLRKLSVLLKEL